MDTILRENDKMHCIEHSDLPSDVHVFTLFERVFTRKWLRTKQIFDRIFCLGFCHGNNDLVADWEFDIKVRRTVTAMQYDDVEFSELVNRYNDAVEIDNYVDEALLSTEVGRLLVDDKVVATGGITNPQCSEHAATLPSSPDRATQRVAHLERVVRSKKGVKTHRRRKRVVPFVVVSLINKIRAKYYHMDNTSANKRLIGSYLLKLMREHGFRTCDIHLHAKYAVDLYFDLQGSDMSPSVYARC